MLEGLHEKLAALREVQSLTVLQVHSYFLLSSY
jgi:hypothetical protein